MVNTIYGLIWLAALWIWGDWKNWKKYYPTILFFILGDFLYLYLLSDHYPMWRYNPAEMDGNVGITNTHISLSIILIKYPATVLIYLSKFPKEDKKKQCLYILFWVSIYAVNEMIDVKIGLIEYLNGWNYWWSMLFNVAMFIILRVHFRNPVRAWLLSAVFIVFLWTTFDVPASIVFR